MEERTAAAEALTELILEVFRVNGDLLAAGDRLTAETGQTSSRWQVLGAIRDSGRPVAAIAREMGLARQSVQRTADLLAREGIVEYVDNPAHRRAKLVVLTATGRRTLASISAGQVAWANDLARAVGADARRIREATSVLRAMRVQLETADGPRRAARASRARTRVDHETGDGDGERGADQPLRGSGRPGRR
jgi:DNA-binding MarR family transcriptional regulator